MRTARLALLAALLGLAQPAPAQRAAQQNALAVQTPTMAAATSAAKAPPPPNPAQVFGRALGPLQNVLVPIPRSIWDSSIWDDPDRGFFWYPPDDPPPALAVPEPERKKSIKEMATLEEVERELRRLRSEAIMNPTQDNVREYLAAQVYVMDKSAVFADVARRASWTEPDLAYTARMPVTNSALTNFRDRRAQSEQEVMTALARDHGLVFVYRSDCHFCKDQAPVLKYIEGRYRFPVMAVSLDGGRIKEFPDAKPDNGISMILSEGKGITMVPAIYLVHRETRASTAIGFGAMAADEIVKRIRVLTRTAPGEEF
jgi:conjugal transfer pilus assembly protein TraF